MSGIAGLINLDGAPVDQIVIRKMMNHLAYRGPDGQSLWVNANVGLAHVLLRTTPEALDQTQPYTIDKRVWITADARIDNRSELIELLQPARHENLQRVSDQHLILCAYFQWGLDAMPKLIGDFAFTIWDRNARRLVCVCDALAMRSLYYVHDLNRLVFGTSIGSLLVTLNHTPAPNEPFIAEFLAGSLSSGNTETFFDGIYRLPPGHLLLVEDEQVRQIRYYEFGKKANLHYSSDDQYTEHFRSLLEQAVFSCLRSSTPIGIQLSGGMDSSALTCIANDMLSRGILPSSTSISSFSFISPNIPEMDESNYQQIVLENCHHLKPITLNIENLWSMKSFGVDDGHPFHQPEPHPMRSAVLGASQRMNDEGIRVVLSGQGSDMVNGRINGYVSDGVIRDLNWRSRLAEWQFYRQHNSLKAMLLPRFKRFPIGLAWHTKSLRRRDQLRHQFPHLTTDWLINILPQNDKSNLIPSSTLPTRASRIAYEVLLSGWEAVFRSCSDTSSGFAHIETRYPYQDRRLIDFMLQVPTHMLVRRGWDKYILRQAVPDLVPIQVRSRIESVDASELVHRGLRKFEKKRIISMMNQSLIVKHGWVNDEAWRTTWHNYWVGNTDSYNRLFATLSVEAWLRAYWN